MLRLIPPGAIVLDAPCGTGKYFPMLAAAGVRVAGADQSAGMLAKARARGIAFSLEHTSLQDLSYLLPELRDVAAGQKPGRRRKRVAPVAVGSSWAGREGVIVARVRSRADMRR